jgi:hypothetical protein
MDYEQKRFEAIKKLIPIPISGGGLVNSLINKLPFEMHLPGGYQYAGPGTHLDLRLAKGIKPKNKLDAAALRHDIAYSKSKNLSDRHVADKILEEEAWERVKAPDSSLGEKAMSWLTCNTMRAKRAIGAGLKKTVAGYVNHPVNLDEDERMLLLTAAEKKKPLELTVNLIRSKFSIMNETSLPLTQSQIKKIEQARKQSKDSLKIKLSAKQVQTFKTGGFLPALIAGIPAIASVLGSVYNNYQNKKANDRLVEERIRHNRVLEEGKGLWVNKKPKALGGGGGRRRRKNKGEGLWVNKKPKALGGGTVGRRRPANKKPKMLGGNVLMQELMRKKKYSVE